MSHGGHNDDDGTLALHSTSPRVPKCSTLQILYRPMSLVKKLVQQRSRIKQNRNPRNVLHHVVDERGQLHSHVPWSQWISFRLTKSEQAELDLALSLSKGTVQAPTICLPRVEVVVINDDAESTTSERQVSSNGTVTFCETASNMHRDALDYFQRARQLQQKKRRKSKTRTPCRKANE